MKLNRIKLVLVEKGIYYEYAYNLLNNVHFEEIAKGGV